MTKSKLEKVLIKAFGWAARQYGVQRAAASAYERGDASPHLVHSIREDILHGISAIGIKHPKARELAFVAAVAIATGRLQEDEFWDAVF